MIIVVPDDGFDFGIVFIVFFDVVEVDAVRGRGGQPTLIERLFFNGVILAYPIRPRMRVGRTAFWHVGDQEDIHR